MANEMAPEGLLTLHPEGIVEAGDYLAQLLVRLDSLASGGGGKLPDALSDDLLATLSQQTDPRSLYFGTPLEGEEGADQPFGDEAGNLPEIPWPGLSEAERQSVLERLAGYLSPERL